MTDRPTNIPTVAEAEALVAAAKLLAEAFPNRDFGYAIRLAQGRLRDARDFDARGSLPVTVGSAIHYLDSQGAWRIGLVTRVGRRWVTLKSGIRFDAATGLGDGERASDTDAWRLSRLPGRGKAPKRAPGPSGAPR